MYIIINNEQEALRVVYHFSQVCGIIRSYQIWISIKIEIKRTICIQTYLQITTHP